MRAPRDKARVQREPFDTAAELERLKAVSRRIGGVVLFVGVVRDFSQGTG